MPLFDAAGKSLAVTGDHDDAGVPGVILGNLHTLREFNDLYA